MINPNVHETANLIHFALTFDVFWKETEKKDH